jgi:NADH dehydrogenase FAD-containing subunit
MMKRLILAGGGHAHMMTLANLDRFVEKGHDVTVIQPSAYHYYSGMGPGMLGKIYRPQEIRFQTQRQVEKKGGRFILDKVVRIDPEAQTVQTAAGGSLPYDVLSCNLGSFVSGEMFALGRKNIYPVKPIEQLLEAQKQILLWGSAAKATIGIIGGGPSAVEVAGNLHRLTRDAGMRSVRIKILTRRALMPRHPDGVRTKAVLSLQKRGIEILEGNQIEKVKNGSATDISGKRHHLDMIFVAVGVRPNRAFEASGIPTGPDGGLLVNRNLQSIAYPNIFGGGDCIYFRSAPLNKVGVFAVRQNPVLLHNITAALEGGTLQSFAPQGNYLLIFNLGDGTGIYYKKPILFAGRLAFILKDFIDRKFMRKFQSM